MEQMTVSEIEKIVDAVADIANVAGKVWENKRIGFDDIGSLLTLSSVGEALSRLASEKVVPQFADLDPTEAAALEARFAARLALPQKTVEIKVEAALGLAVFAYQSVIVAKTKWQALFS